LLFKPNLRKIRFQKSQTKRDQFYVALGLLSVSGLFDQNNSI